MASSSCAELWFSQVYEKVLAVWALVNFFQENFDWHTFEVTDGCKDNVKEITTNSLGSEDFKYGVSIATAELSGGIHWENFRFKNLKDGKKFEKTVLWIVISPWSSSASNSLFALCLFTRIS